MKFEKDFDFESANAQFNKEEIDREFQSKLKLKGISLNPGRNDGFRHFSSVVRPSDGPNSFHCSLRLKMFMRSEVASAVEKSFLLLDLKKQIQVNMHSYCQKTNTLLSPRQNSSIPMR